MKISLSYDQNKFSCFPLMKHSEKQIFLFVYLAKSESLNLRFFRGSVFDLSHMKKSENPGFCKNVRFSQILRIFQMVK